MSVSYQKAHKHIHVVQSYIREVVCVYHGNIFQFNITFLIKTKVIGTAVSNVLVSACDLCT